MAVAGQTINDRILAARHSIAGQGLAKAVCKATTEEVIGPKKKHLDYLMLCTNEPNVSIPTLANLLIERTQNPHWVVVFKGLITTHHLMCYGNERFTQYLASSNSNFQLTGFLDKSGVQGYDMSPFIRRYAKYLSEKSVSYRTVAFDFCKVKRGKDGGMLRTMNSDKLLKTLPVVQQQLDALVDFECTAQDLNNGVINAAFMLLFRDLIRLFACYNDGIINLLEKYFEMNKKQARDALDLYKQFLLRMDKVMDFLKVAENVGIEKSDIPDLAKAPSSLLEALEGHLASLEGRKPGSGGTTPTGNTRVNVAAAVSTLSSTSNAFGTAATNGGGIDERTAQKLLEEEAAAMEKFRSTANASNPFAAAAAAPEPAKEETPNILDLFGVASPPPMTAVSDSNKASEDLLQLAGNPFANMLNAAGSGAPFPPLGTAAPQQPLFMSPNAGYGGMTADFSSVFGPPASAGSAPGLGGPSLFGEVLQPANKPTTPSSNSKVITGDLDSSLANLASNLSFGSAKKSVIGGQSRGPPMAQPAGFNPFPQQQQMGASGFLQPTPAASTNVLSPQLSNGSLHHPHHPAFESVASSTFLASPATFPPVYAGSPGFLSPVLSPSYSFPAGLSSGNSLAAPRPASFTGLSPSGAFTSGVSMNNNSLFYSPNAAFLSSPASDDPRSGKKPQELFDSLL